VDGLTQVPVGVLRPERFRDALSPEKYRLFEAAVAQARELFEGRAIWNINSTARGGGVAEMLRSLLAYARGAGIDARWLVIPGNDDFFRVTKRLHNQLHGATGDGGPLGPEEHSLYRSVLEPSEAELVELVRPEDVVIVHDPQPAGLVAPLVKAGPIVLWRCHVGLDRPNGIARGAWAFLRDYVDPAHGYVFSRRAFVWEGLNDDKITIVPPSIDAFSPKNQDLTDDAVRAILAASAVVPDGIDAVPAFVREDGAPARVDRHAEMIEDGPVPPDAPIVVQVSRWDRLKDPLGVIRGFAEFTAPAVEDAHLIVAGPSVAAVADDPEGAEVLEEARRARVGLVEGVRRRVHLACLPMEDGEENAAIVNALQRRADVVVQKSLAEGFGLTVAEAMWKARPVVASRIGGIQDQISDGDTGLLVDDPRDLDAYGRGVAGLLEDRDAASAMGQRAQEKVRNEFLGPRHLMQYIELIGGLLARRGEDKQGPPSGRSL
jgi:trehalose synthase